MATFDVLGAVADADVHAVTALNPSGDGWCVQLPSHAGQVDAAARRRRRDLDTARFSPSIREIGADARCRRFQVRGVIRGVLLDFYGTVVDEDDDVIEVITRRIAAEQPECSAADIATEWGRAFAAGAAATRTGGLRPQRTLAVDALAQVLAGIGSELTAGALCRPQLAHWRTAALRRGSAEFLPTCPVPICVVSNIDTDDLDGVIAFHRLDLPHRVTSEDVRSYKPRPELFRAALDRLGLPASDVLHIGDSLTSDVAGANTLGIPVAWVNRHARRRPAHAHVDFEITDLRDLLPALLDQD